MRDFLDQLLRMANAPDPERVQRRWEEYRYGACSTDVPTRSAADAAFASLIAWYGNSLYRHIWGFVRSDAADDVFQEVLRKLHERRLSSQLVSFEANVLPWLRTVAIRECVDAYRRSTRRRVRESRAARLNEEAPSDHRSEIEEVLSVALSRLPRHQQQAIALHFFEGLDRQHAAAALGIHRDTLSTHLDAALLRLKKLIATPVALALGTELVISEALARIPRAPTVGRLSELATGISVRTTAFVLSRQQIAVVVVIGLSLSGAGVAAVWPWSQSSTNVVPAAAASDRSEPDGLRVESLQERNLRLLRSEVIPRLLEASQKLVPADNPLHVVDVRAFGSEVECEFQTQRPIVPAWKPIGLRLRYCMLMRKLSIDADVKGDGSWKEVNPERPIILDLAIPGWRIPAVDLGRDRIADAMSAFERLPPDDRAEAEQAERLFGSDPKQLILPAGLRGFAAEAGRLFAVDAKHGLFVRDNAGKWRYDGVCPGWWIAARDGRLYCIRGEEIWMKLVDAPSSTWRPWCKFPNLRSGERSGFLAIAGGQLFAVIQPGVLCSRSISDPNGKWRRESKSPPIWPDGFAATADRLIAHDQRELLSRASDKEDADWTPIARWPDRCTFLAIDGDHLLAFGGPGPILARPLSAGADVQWDVVGRIVVPPSR